MLIQLLTCGAKSQDIMKHFIYTLGYRRPHSFMVTLSHFQGHGMHFINTLIMLWIAGYVKIELVNFMSSYFLAFKSISQFPVGGSSSVYRVYRLVFTVFTTYSPVMNSMWKSWLKLTPREKLRRNCRFFISECPVIIQQIWIARPSILS